MTMPWAPAGQERAQRVGQSVLPILGGKWDEGSPAEVVGEGRFANAPGCQTPELLAGGCG